jgi:hypothetical protein
MNRIFVALAVVAFTAVPAAAQSTVICESTDGSYRECRLEGPGVATLTRQMSDRNCIEGQTWGYRDGKIWVDKGCRAQFALTSRVASAPLDSRIVCESEDNRLTRCSAATAAGVQLIRRMSSASCEYGKDWGYDRDGIWVSNGCRAEFAISGGRPGLSAPMFLAANPTTTLVCESIDGRRNHCRADTNMGVLLTRQMSGSTCDYGVTWGIDQNGVWVTRGCRAEFMTGDSRVGRGMTSSAAAATIVCESENGEHKHCRADTRYGVSLLRQLSDKRCERNRTWGVDDAGVWVTNGCRAEFVLDRR